MFAALSLASLAPWAAVFACSLLLSTIVRFPQDCLGSRHMHAGIQTNAELTGGLLGDRPSTSSRCRHALTQHSSHPGDDSNAPLARACLDMPQWHTPYMGKCLRVRTAVGCVGRAGVHRIGSTFLTSPRPRGPGLGTGATCYLPTPKVL